MKSALKQLFSKSSLNPNANVKIKQEKKFFIAKDIKVSNIQNLVTNLNKSTNQVHLTKMEKFPDVLYMIRNDIGQINALTKMIKI